MKNNLNYNTTFVKAGVRSALNMMACAFNTLPSCRKYLKHENEWINFSAALTTEDGDVAETIIFKDGKVRVKSGSEDATCVFKLVDKPTLMSMASLPPNELLNLMVKNKMATTGNLIHISYFDFLLSVLLHNKQIKQINKQKKEQTKKKKKYAIDTITTNVERKKKEYLKCDTKDKGVKYLEEQYLSEYSLEDFPRIKKFLDEHFDIKPAICIERPYLLTKWYKENGFEKDNNGNDWNPDLRQGYAFKYLMDNKKAIIRENDLLAGTTTEKQNGVIIYPDTTGPYIWGELYTIGDRTLNPCDITKDERWALTNYIFPYWINRNIREWVRNKYDNSKCQQLDERFACNFQWKTVAISHTVIDNEKYLKLGARGIIEEINKAIKNDPDATNEKNDERKAMILCFEGIINYAHNLSVQAKIDAENTEDPVRKEELLHIADICSRIPEQPCKTLDEAVNAMSILWIAVHMENTNAGFSLGRMDQYLQPYFVSDIKKIKSKEERQAYIKHAIELICCFYIKCTDHLPTVPDIGNYLFGGASSNQAITLGGVTPKGDDAVNDMTYIFLKVTEMLGLRDPNINTRFHNKKNSEAFLRRLCEVNVNTTGTPAMHNDEMIMKSLTEFNYPQTELNNWSATGCVEPTITGKHIGHTNCMMFNMVAALEMAMYNGYHPLMRWELGPKTGEPESFKTFDDFFNAFCEQIKCLCDLSREYNNKLGEAHSVVRPTPMMSALVDGCIKKGKDVTKGGAKYNSSGIAGIGLADVTDSMMMIKKFVYDDKKYTLSEVINAVKENFVDYEVMRNQALTEVPLFGSGSEEAVAMANRITKFMHDYFGNKTNFRGGKYTVGFWSMSNHVAFGTLTGALPSGRLAGKPFTPGLTPEPNASKSLLENIKDVAKLESQNTTNNITFNVKVVPAPTDSHEEIINHLYSYAKAYCDLGGMQMQFNVVSSDTMRAAMANPSEHKDLLVRISGYNAYFVTLNPDLQMELIERAEYSL